MITQYDHLIKLILVGGSGVGKSSLFTQFTQNKFSDYYQTTVGVDFKFKIVKQDGKSIKFQIWDTAGQERFRTISSVYYKGADGIIMVYDLSDPTSVDDLENYWIGEAEKYCDKSIKVLLLGNKCDTEKLVNPNKIKKIVQKHGYKTEQVSAKTGEKVIDSITNFGIEIVRDKMNKIGEIWSSHPSLSNNPTLAGSKKIALSAEKGQKKLQKESKDPIQLSSKKIEAHQTIQIKGHKRVGAPSYQKKCC